MVPSDGSAPGRGARAAAFAVLVAAAAVIPVGCDGDAHAQDASRPARASHPDGAGGPAPAPARGPRDLADLPIHETHLLREAAPDLIREVGVVAARRELSLGFVESGTIIEIVYEAGDQVDAERGVVVARLDPEPFDARIARAEAMVAQAESQLGWASLVRTREEKLVAQDLRDREALDRAVYGETEAKARLDAAKADLRLARFRKAKSVVTVPTGHFLTDVAIEVGELVTPGTPVVRAVDIATVEIELGVRGEHLPLVAPETELSFVVKELPARTFTAKVASVVPKADERTRRFPVVLRLANPELQLKPGFAAVVQLGRERAAPAAEGAPALVRIPRRALLERHRALFCFVVTPPSGSPAELTKGYRRWSVRQVPLRRSPDPADDGPDALSVSGVKEGDRVLLGPNLELLTDGGAIRVAEERDPSNTPPVKR